MLIRSAVPSDVPAIAAVGRATWPPTYSFAGPEFIAYGLTTWWSTAAIKQSLTDTSVLVAVTGEGDLIGIGNIDVRPPMPTIWKLYVRPDAQGTGAGKALLTALVASAPGRPVRLGYADGNERAAGFYRAFGFTETTREPAADPAWPETIWMRRPAGWLSSPGWRGGD